MSTPLPLVGVPGPMQRRLGAIVMAGQTPVLVFGTLALWGLAKAQDDPRQQVFLLVGGLVTLLAVVAAGTMRRPFGVTLGWLVQLATIGAAVFSAGIAVVGVIFAALWATALIQGHRLDALTASRERAQSGT